MPPASRRARDADVLSTDTPMQVQIYRQLRSEIVDGLWVDRDDFPGDRELGERFGVSVITSRGALERLQREGLIERQRGRGTRAVFVPEDEDPPAAPPLFPPPDDLEALHYEVVRSGVRIAPAAACRAFGVPMGSHLWQVVRVASFGGTPQVVFHNVQLPETGERHAAEDLASRPMVSIFRSEGVPIARVHRTVQATSAPPIAARHLGLSLDAPVLQLVLRAATADDETLEWTRAFTRPDQPLPEEVLDLATGRWSGPSG